jgi:hypothetical protein
MRRKFDSSKRTKKMLSEKKQRNHFENRDYNRNETPNEIREGTPVL